MSRRKNVAPPAGPGVRVREFLAKIEEAIDHADDIADNPEMVSSGRAFARSVRKTLEGIQRTVTDTEQFTFRQEKAIAHIQEGLKGWSRGPGLSET